MSSSSRHHKEYVKATRNWDLQRDPAAYRVRAGDRILSEAEEMAILVNEDILPLIQASRRSSRQGVLLEIIELKAGGQSEGDRHIFSRTLHGYRGYRRGFKRLVRFGRADYGDDQPSVFAPMAKMPPTFGGRGRQRSLTPSSWACPDLIHIPAVRICALESMHAEMDKFDPDYVLRLITEPGASDPMTYELLYVMLTQSSRFESHDYVDAILPFVDHPDQNIFDLAVAALGRTRRGERQLQRRYNQLRAEGKMEPDRLAEFATRLADAEI